MKSAQEKKDDFKKLIEVIENLKGELEQVFSKGTNTETAEMVFMFIDSKRKTAQNILPEFNKLRKPEKVDFIRKVKNFFEATEKCTTMVQAIDAYNTLKKIHA